MLLTTSSKPPIAFADDPSASHSAQFGLGRPMDSAAPQDAPSPVGARPWNLRTATTCLAHRWFRSGATTTTGR
jgi:hypothetical protein